MGYKLPWYSPLSPLVFGAVLVVLGTLGTLNGWNWPFDTSAESTISDGNLWTGLGILGVFPIFGWLFCTTNAFGIGYVLSKFVSLFPDEPPKWRGGMECKSCYYKWKSRRKTSPRQCPDCRGRDVEPILETDKGWFQ
jgi:hypothetical protein